MRQLTLLILTNIVTVALLLVTIIAKVCIAPTEPLSYTTAILAFEVDEVSAVLFTVFNATLHRRRRAFAANELFWFKFLLLHCVNTVFFASEICIFAFETLIVSEFVHRVCLKVVEIEIIFVFKSWILI